MTDLERKAWEKLKRGVHRMDPWHDCILAADKELKRLTEENGRMREAVEWACENACMYGYEYESSKFEAELRRRAAIGT